MKLYLIGMPLSGKSVVGELLANKLGLGFIDLDRYIEEKTQKQVFDLVLEDETHFRNLETDALIDLIDKEDIVIATGGGIVLNRDHKQLMRGIIIYLDVPLEVLEGRLDNSYQRPLLRNQSLQDLLEQRIHQFRYFQTYTIKAKTIDEAVKAIMDKLTEENLL